MVLDFCIESKDAKIFKNLAKNGKFKVDLFYDGFIFSEQLPDDYIDKSSKAAADLNNIDMRTLSLIDIIITKTARYNERDEEDITAIAKMDMINKQELIDRFKQVAEIFAGREKDYEYHFNLILKRHFN